MENRALIQNSLDYIEENLQAEIHAAELADAAGYSLFHFYRLFQRVVGLSVGQYILRRRLLHGIYRISQGMAKVDAALLYGFDTYAGFYKAFCREFDCSPSDYLRYQRAKRPYRIILDKEEHVVVTHKKATQILRNWNLENETITDIYYEGTRCKNENACYVGDRYVLKYTENIEKMKRHFALSKAVENVGLRAAVPVSTETGQEYVQDGDLFYYVTRRLSGSQMEPVDFYEGDPVRNARFVGEMIGQIHLVLSQDEDCINDADLLASTGKWALPAAKPLLGLTDAFCQEFLEQFGRLYPELPRQVIHRDPNPGNIICGEDTWGFIDFDLAERNARIFDPCYAATAVLSESDEADRDRWLEIYRNIIYGYDSIVPLTQAEYEAIPYVILANQFQCVAWFSAYEKHQEAYQKNLDMTKWLIRHLDDLKIIENEEK